MYGQLVGQMGRYRTRSVALRGNLDVRCSSIEPFLEAVAAGDAEEAARLLLACTSAVPQRRFQELSDDELRRMS